MALGRRNREQQQTLWVATEKLATAPRHVFYERLNRLLTEAGFDKWLETRCRRYYSQDGRPSIPPGVFFRMVFIGYFENIDSQRGIAWRCSDSLSLKAFLGYAPHQETPDHSSLTRIRNRLPEPVFDEVFQMVLRIVETHGLLDGRTMGVDSTTLEANAAMKAIVRRDTNEDWTNYLKRLAAEDGVPAETKPELIRYDKKRNKKGKKKVSNDDWTSPADPDARITRMKDGTTNLAYKAEHVVDLKTEVIVSATIHHADQADSATITSSVAKAQENLDQSEAKPEIEKVTADKGYHKLDVLVACETLTHSPIKTYIPEADNRWNRCWDDKTAEQERAYRLNRDRTQRAYGKRLQRRRSEVVERSFGHICDTGQQRRTWLRGIANVSKRYQMQAAAYNLGIVLRKLIGAGKPRAFWALWACFCAHLMRLTALTAALRTIQVRSHDCGTRVDELFDDFDPNRSCWGGRFLITPCSTGC